MLTPDDGEAEGNSKGDSLPNHVEISGEQENTKNESSLNQEERLLKVVADLDQQVGLVRVSKGVSHCCEQDQSAADAADQVAAQPDQHGPALEQESQQLGDDGKPQQAFKN
jgi:hypothetical protein